MNDTSGSRRYICHMTLRKCFTVDLMRCVMQETIFPVPLQVGHFQGLPPDTTQRWAAAERQMEEHDQMQANADKARNDLEAYMHECKKRHRGELITCADPATEELRMLLDHAEWAVQYECQDEAVRTSSCRLPDWSGKCFLCDAACGKCL